VHEYALAVLGLDGGTDSSGAQLADAKASRERSDRRFPLAEAAHAAGSLDDVQAVRAWRSEPQGDEAELPRDALSRAVRDRRSVRVFGDEPLPREAVVDLLAWAEAPVPSDVPRVVRQALSVAAVEGLVPGTYGSGLDLLREHDERELRERAGLAAMDQDHAKDAAVNVFQMADLEEVVAGQGDRGYRWAQLEAGIRAGRVQVGAFLRGLGAVASTFFDAEVSRLLETHESPMLMVALGPRRRRRQADAPE
jgi:nitroreductase